MGVNRRRLLGNAVAAAAGTVAGAVLTRQWPLLGPNRLPLSGGYAPAGIARGWSSRGQVEVHWHVPTKQPFVALTFDDGPGPRWTPMVLDTLERTRTPATFFVVGQQLSLHADLIRGRLGRHELGNHSWGHRDLAQLDEAGVRDELGRTHEAIKRLAGQLPTLMRPPWGHLGGSTLVAADEFGYDVVMWSQQMEERTYQRDPPAQARDIVEHARPGSIVLAHDIGPEYRLVALRQLGAIVDGLRACGLQPVTVSELLASTTPAQLAGPAQPA